jgi:RNA polymerase sigma-70 factor, ECF subfamily
MNYIQSEQSETAPIRTEDDLLMIQLQEGDNTAFDQLVTKYEGELKGFFYRQTRDKQQAEDLAQETFLKVYNQSWDYIPLGKFKSWMYRIGRNLFIDSIRKQARDALVKAIKGHNEDEEDRLARLSEEILSPEEIAQFKELSSQVDEALSSIPEDQRMTFTLHHYSELSLSEVADVMQTSLATTKSRLRLAREKLREKLNQIGIKNPALQQE